jgi:very-short-patch-repair endonuclease
VVYWRLRKVLPEQMVLSQVAVSRFLRVEKGHDFRGWLNRVDRMTVDFLVCLPDGTIVAAIELDDNSHDLDERVLADAKKTKALESAGIKLLRWRELPTEADLRRAFLE